MSQTKHNQAEPKATTAGTPAIRVAFVVTMALGTIVVGCADSVSAPLAPESTTARSRPAAIKTASESGSVEQLFQLEKERIKLAEDKSRLTYEQLKRDWDALHKLYRNRDTTLLYCEPLRYAAEVKIIGPEGGDLAIGPHRLSIPAGALAGRTVITGEMPVSLNVGVQLSQHGLRFMKGANLALSYKHCNRPQLFSEEVVYVDDNANILERPASVDKDLDHIVESIIWHFSGYMVSTGRTAPSDSTPP